MTATIINSIIALILGTYAIKYRNTSYVIFILFIYISLHYSYSVIAIFGSSEYLYIRTNTQIGAKVIGLGFLFFLAGLIVITKRKILLSAIQLRPIRPTSRIYFIVIIWIVIVGISWVFDISQGKYPSSLALQDVVSSFIMLNLACIIGVVMPDFYSELDNRLKKMLQIILIMAIVMVALSLYQIIAFKIFAGVTNKDGEYERRACALLLNPNVLGLWCALIAAVTAYAFHTKRCPKVTTSLMLALTALGIFLSGSRSGLLICLFMLGLVSFLQFKFRRWVEITFSFYPFFIFISSLTGMGMFIKIFDSLSNLSYKWLHALSVLVDRFANMPEEIGTYTVFKLTGYIILVSGWLHEHTSYAIFSRTHTSAINTSKNLSETSIFINIDGRLNVDIPLPDNGYLAMYHDAGWPGLLAWLILWMVIVWMGVKSFRINPGINSVYALSAICTCLFAAIFIRLFQVYPLWIMVSIALGISLSWFQTVIGHKGFSEHS